MSDQEKYLEWLRTAEELALSPHLHPSKKKVIGQVARILLEAERLDRPSGHPGPVDTDPTAEPRFEHDCIQCVFLGHWIAPDTVGKFDLYYCPQTLQRHDGNLQGIQTVIARYASDPSAYRSGLLMAGQDEVLAEAKRRATTRGLLR